MNRNEIKIETEDFLLIKYWKLTLNRFILFILLFISWIYFFNLFLSNEKKSSLLPSSIFFFLTMSILIVKKKVIVKKEYLRIYYSFFYWTFSQESIRQIRTVGRKTIIGKSIYKIEIVLRNTIRFTLFRFSNAEYTKSIENKIAKRLELDVFDQVNSQEE